MLVIGAHLQLVVRPPGIAGTIGWLWASYGRFGVPLFFSLSGYLVGGLLLTEMRRYGSIDVTRFLIRRGLKIYPAYFVFLAYLVVMPTIKAVANGDVTQVSKLLWSYLPNFVFLNNYLGPDPARHTWSLAVEEHFYLTLPLLLVAALRWRLTAWLAPLCLLAPAFWTGLRGLAVLVGDPYSSEMSATHLCLDGLLIGVGVRALAEFSPKRFAALRPWRWPLICAAIAMLAAVPPANWYGASLWRIAPVAALAGTGIFVGVLHIRAADFGPASGIASMLARALAWIGAYSYSIYLWHVTVIGFTLREIGSRLPSGSPSVHYLLSSAAIILISVLFGALMSRLVEWPVLAVRDRWFPSRSAQSRPASVLARPSDGHDATLGVGTGNVFASPV